MVRRAKVSIEGRSQCVLRLDKPCRRRGEGSALRKPVCAPVDAELIAAPGRYEDATEQPLEHEGVLVNCFIEENVCRETERAYRGYGATRCVSKANHATRKSTAPRFPPTTS
jgi:hypothetical protein